MIDLIRTNDDLNTQKAIVIAFTDHADDIPFEWIEDAFASEDIGIREVAARMASEREDTPLDFIDKMRTDWHWYVRKVAYNSFSVRDDIPYEWKIEALSDKEYINRIAAVDAFIGAEDIPTEISKLALNANMPQQVRTHACNVLLNAYLNNKEEDN